MKSISSPSIFQRDAYYPFHNRFKKIFSSYLEDGIGSEDIEDIYKSAHESIRQDPVFKPTDKSKDWKAESLKYKTRKLTYDQRKERIQEKIDKFGTGEDDE